MRNALTRTAASGGAPVELGEDIDFAQMHLRLI